MKRLSVASFLVSLLVLALSFDFAARAEAHGWEPVRTHIMSKWAKKVNPDRVLPDYPRPQMVRKRWLNLNGLWQFDTVVTTMLPFGKRLPGKILVPFPIESALSGVAKHSANIIYRRTFFVPHNWNGKRILLHFGGVDWATTVYVNGKHVGTHKGGYDPFTFDITSALHTSGRQDLLVRVYDPTDNGLQPTGKQSVHPGRIYYTPVTGIWQSVWLEPVSLVYIKHLRLISNIDKSTISISADLNSRVPGYTLRGEVEGNGKVIARKSGDVRDTLCIYVPHEKLWSPSRPYLYGLSLFLMKGGQVVDSVKSYFGMRKISIGKGPEGITRILLNNKFVFLDGPLYQGYWPGGLYAAPSESAMKYDIETVKRLGFNMIRVHQIVEPQRWYYWCDRLGLVLFQDMPGVHRHEHFKSRETPQTDREFRKELERMVETHWNHPSIVMWTLFNEGWGQHDTKGLTRLVRKLDQTRLVDDASGWHDEGVGSVVDVHRYPGPAAPIPEKHRAAILGEFGGLGLPVRGHLWENEHWGYRVMRNPGEFLRDYKRLFEKVFVLKDEPGLSAAVYTQLTDVETEMNGLMTYDRAVLKLPVDEAYRINRDEIPALPVIKPGHHLFVRKVRVTISNAKNQTMRYTTDGSVPGMHSDIYVKPLLLTKTTTLKVKTFCTKGAKSSMVTVRFLKSDFMHPIRNLKDFKAGILYSYYEGEWAHLSDISKLHHEKTGVVSAFHTPQIKTGAKDYAIKYQGYIRILKSGIYTFSLVSERSGQVYIGGKEIASNVGVQVKAIMVKNHGFYRAREDSGEVALHRGLYRIKVWYWHPEGTSHFGVFVDGPCLTKESVPSSMLFH